MLPRSGDILHVGRDANVQFDGDRAIAFRVIRTHDWPTYTGWIWLDGYELDRLGQAVERRSIFVMIAGLFPAPDRLVPTPDPRTRNSGARRVADRQRRAAAAASTVRR